MAEALRYNEDKPELSYLPRSFPKMVEAVARVMQFGAAKYEDGNWQKGGKPDKEYWDSLFRHLSYVWQGQDYDEDSACLHLGHAVWNLCALLELNYPDLPATDGRFKERCDFWRAKKEELNTTMTGDEVQSWLDEADVFETDDEDEECNGTEKSDEVPKFVFPDTQPWRKFKGGLENLQRINNPPTPGLRFEIKDKEKLDCMKRLDERIAGFYQRYTLEQIDKFLTVAASAGIDPFEFIDGIEKATRDLKKVEDYEKAAKELAEWSKKYDEEMKEQCIQVALDHLYSEAGAAEQRYFSWLNAYGHYLKES